ncbi:SDR family NAD(P)-dependent oxidoreductase [Acetobacter sp. P5B1]|uniref:SDR family NAD(P)-dependent oxidoreductase n=1 Tax=Acetobacter sp. P5B1 TaxID=2762620 RepID=UPI001C05CCC4|nr:SDR family oxidoreductase [Acetobacter sp. P5B1]
MAFNGKILTITGGSGGIGTAVAKRFTDAGGTVLLLGRSEEKGRATEKACGPGATFIRCDVSNADDVANVFEMIDAEYGGIDFAVNNAGVTTPYVSLDKVEVSDWRKVLSINLDGVFYAMKHQLPMLIRRQGSAIVNVSSCAGVVPIPMQAAYVASKSAVNALTRATALEYATESGGLFPVRINAVAPGPTLGGMNTPERLAAHPQNTERKRNSTAMRRFGTPDEIVNVIEWLLSDKSSFVTGQVISPDGGYNAGKIL